VLNATGPRLFTHVLRRLACEAAAPPTVIIVSTADFASTPVGRQLAGAAARVIAERDCAHQGFATRG